MSKLKFASILFFISTLVLKFSSMLRDLVIANYFGASYVVDAYNAAMIIPNAFILFMLTGMKDAFVPSYFKFEKEGKGFSHLTNIVKGTFIIGLVVSIIGAVLSPFLIPFLYPEFNTDGTKIAIWTSAIYFFSVFLVGINAVYEGYFDAQGKYSFSTFSQTIVVFCTIGSAILLSGLLGAYSLPIGYFVGTLISFLIKLFYMKPTSFIHWSQRMNHTEIKEYYKIFLPVGLTIMVGQINLIVNTLYAGRFGDGVISYLNYAFRLVSIPQAIFGVTIATIIFPILSKAMTSNNLPMFRKGMEKGLSIMFLFLAPTVTAMMLLMREVIQIVYQRGAFDELATNATSEVAIYYIGSVLFYSIQVIIAKGFYTLEKGSLILRIGFISIILNIVLNYVFSSLIGYKGLALSFSVVGFIYTAIAFVILYKLIGGFSLKYLGVEYTKIVAAAMIMLASMMVIEKLIKPYDLHIYLYVLVVAGIGGIIYLFCLLILRTTALIDIVRRKNLQSELK